MLASNIYTEDQVAYSLVTRLLDYFEVSDLNTRYCKVWNLEFD